MENEGVDLIGEVEDVHVELSQATCALVPLRSGSGTRIKILEAWAFGLPVISTLKGAEGLDSIDNANILIAESPVAFADAAQRLVDDAELAQRMVQMGKSTHASTYSADVFQRTVMNLVEMAELDP